MCKTIMKTCFTISQRGPKKTRGVAAKRKNVEDHRCHRARLLLVVRVVGLRSWEYVFADDGLFLHFSGGLMVAFDSACLQFFSQDCAALNLYLEKVDEVDGEDGPHAIVGEPFAGFHPDDEENPSENNQ